MQTFTALTCLAAILSAALSDARSFTGHERHLLQIAGEKMQILALESESESTPKQDTSHTLPA